MNSKYASIKLDYLDLLFHDFEEQELDDYMKSHIAKYLTVLCSGIFEDIIKNFIVELAQKDKMSKEIKGYLFKQIQWSFKNPSYENLIKFINRFNKDWSIKLNEKIEEKNKVALSSIVYNKNLIAHGNSSSITFPEITLHYENSKEIIEQLDEIILANC